MHGQRIRAPGTPTTKGTKVEQPKPVEVFDDFKRDRWGRPLIAPIKGSKLVSYIRSSSAAKVVDDTYNLELWARRGVVYGMAHSPDLVAQVLALGGAPQTWDKAEKIVVNDLAVEAQRVSKAHAAAEIGTALHRMTERLDHGETVEAGEYQGDLDAYTAALANAGVIIEPAWIECKIVCDSLQMAGTADRIVRLAADSPIRQCLPLGPDEVMIADLKTGATVNYGALGFSAQLAAYAHGQLYDIQADKRLPTPTISKQKGLIIHLPAGQATCALYLVDLVEGYAAAELANRIRKVRQQSKRWLEPVQSGDEICDTCEASGRTTLTYWGQRLCSGCGKNAATFYDMKDCWPARPGDGHIEEACKVLAERLTTARQVKGMPPGWVWPADVPRFSAGGPATWVDVLRIERLAENIETYAQMPFLVPLGPDPTLPKPVEVRFLPVEEVARTKAPESISPGLENELADRFWALPDEWRKKVDETAQEMGISNAGRLWAINAEHVEALIAEAEYKSRTLNPNQGANT